jgi:hypothetical protein
MSRRSSIRRAANWFALACAAYLGLAYFAAPAFWTWRDRDRAADGPRMLTRTPQGIAGDPLNVGLVGNRAEVLRAFASAKWDTADAVTLKSAVEIGESVLFDRPYPDAPVSPLLFEGRAQDLAFEKPLGNSADQRHHVRFWRTREPADDGRPLWLGSASFDRGVGLSHDTGAVTHHIAPDIDAERDSLIDDLATAGMLASTHEIDGVGPTRTGRNGEGDAYFTDGKATIGILKSVP